MKYIILLISFTFAQVPSITHAFDEKSEFELKFDNIIIESDTITIKIFTYGHPKNDSEFEKFMSELGDKIMFKDDMDGMSFWLYVIAINNFNDYKNYEQSFNLIINQTNDWLNDKYGDL